MIYSLARDAHCTHCTLHTVHCCKGCTLVHIAQLQFQCILDVALLLSSSTAGFEASELALPVLSASCTCYPPLSFLPRAVHCTLGGRLKCNNNIYLMPTVSLNESPNTDFQNSQSIFLFGKSSASCTFYLGSMELLCTLGGNVINPDRSEKKLIGQGHKRQNLGSVVHCIGRLHHLHQHWHRRHRDWGQGSVSVLRVTINIFTNSLYFGAGDKYQV